MDRGPKGEQRTCSGPAGSTSPSSVQPLRLRERHLSSGAVSDERPPASPHTPQGLRRGEGASSPKSCFPSRAGGGEVAGLGLESDAEAELAADLCH